MRFFHRTLVVFNNLWIHFIFREFINVSLCLKYLVQLFKWRLELGIWEVVFFPVPEVIVYSFLVYFGIVQIWHMYHSWEKRIGLRLSFYLPKRISLCSRYVFFTVPSRILSHLEQLRIELPKLTPSILMKIV